MSHKMRSLFRIVLLVAIVAAPVSVRAQAGLYADQDSIIANELTNRLPTIIVLGAETGLGTAEIRRGVGSERRDVVILPADADAIQLVRSVAALQQLRALGGYRVEQERRFRTRLVPDHAARAGQERGEQARAARLMARLRQETPRALEGIGSVRYVEVYLPRPPRVTP